MQAFCIFYVVGGIIGILINLRFSLPNAYFDITQAWDFLRVLQTIGYHVIRIIILSCIVFFASWISVGFFYIYYDDFKRELDNSRL